MPPTVQGRDLIAAAEAAGATIVRSPAATVIVITHAAPASDDLVPIAEAATLAQCSVRTLRDARRAGELAAYGKQRSRAVRRSDLLAWIDSRRVRPVVGVDDDAMDRRIARLERARAARTA